MRSRWHNFTRFPHKCRPESQSIAILQYLCKIASRAPKNTKVLGCLSLLHKMVPCFYMTYAYPLMYFRTSLDNALFLENVNCMEIPIMLCCLENNVTQGLYPVYTKVRVRIHAYACVFWDRASLCSPGWPGAQYLGQAGLKPIETHLPLAPQSWD